MIANISSFKIGSNSKVEESRSFTGSLLGKYANIFSLKPTDTFLDFPIKGTLAVVAIGPVAILAVGALYLDALIAVKDITLNTVNYLTNKVIVKKESNFDKIWKFAEDNKEYIIAGISLVAIFTTGIIYRDYLSQKVYDIYNMMFDNTPPSTPPSTSTSTPPSTSTSTPPSTSTSITNLAKDSAAGVAGVLTTLGIIKCYKGSQTQAARRFEKDFPRTTLSRSSSFSKLGPDESNAQLPRSSSSSNLGSDQEFLSTLNEFRNIAAARDQEAQAQRNTQALKQAMNQAEALDQAQAARDQEAQAQAARDQEARAGDSIFNELWISRSRVPEVQRSRGSEVPPLTEADLKQAVGILNEGDMAELEDYLQ